MIDLNNPYPRPDWVRRINSMGDSVGGAQHIVPIQSDTLVNRAMGATGLDDFGDFDGNWRQRLDALIDGLEDTAGLNVMGRLLTSQEILRCLTARLLLTQSRKAQPAILEERIETPIVIAGPARSGTTILHELLALDPRCRAPLAYELLHPVPRAELAGDRRREVSECEQEIWANVQPEFATIHELAAHLPMECLLAQQPAFAGFHWPMIANIPTFDPSFQAAMAYHRAVLQQLQFGNEPRNWILKTPAYLFMLELLFETYPDASVVVTHRDPVKTIPSSFNTQMIVRWMRSDHVGMQYEEAGESEGADKEPGKVKFSHRDELLLGLLSRKQSGQLPDSVVDILFADLMSKPVETIEAMYDAMGRAFDPAHGDAIRSYLAAKPKGKFGAHRYSPEDFGFYAAGIREEMREYIDFYGVPLED